jgi:hypothetical protein
MIDTIALIRDFLVTSVAAPATGTLSGDITATATTITLGAGEGASFPSSQNFVIKVDSELIQVQSRTTDTLTIEPAGIGRGAMGTTAAAHTNGTTVSQANLYLTVGARVCCPKIPENYDNDEPLIRFFPRGGRTDAGVEIHDPSFQFDCLGGSFCVQDSLSVYRMLHDRLHGQHDQTTTNGYVISAYEEGLGRPLEYPDTKPPWPYTLAFFRVICNAI